MTTIKNVKILSFTVLKNQYGDISVFQGLTFSRFFIVNSTINQTRGAHAHKKCTQLLCAIKGSIKVSLSDGYSSQSHLLNNGSNLVLIPPGIWAIQEYERGSQLLVMCDLEFDELDYIRDWNEYLTFIRVSRDT